MKKIFKVKIAYLLVLPLMGANLAYSSTSSAQHMLKEGQKDLESSNELNKKSFEESKKFVENQKKEIEEDKSKLDEIKKENGPYDLRTARYLCLVNQQLIKLRSFLISEHEKENLQKFSQTELANSQSLRIYKQQLNSINAEVKKDKEVEK